MKVNKMQYEKKTFLISIGFISFGIFLLSLFAVLFKGVSSNNDVKIQHLAENHKAREFSLQRIDKNILPINFAAKEKISLSDLKGRTLIINFWASWCMTCRAEAHILEDFWQEHKDKGVVVLGVAVHDSLDDASEAAKLLNKTYPVGLDVGSDISIDYGVVGVPETYFINAQGVVVSKHIGALSKEVLEKNLANLKSEHNINRG
jgi:cytochrome c biogenesis protein CcmG, thiol:disulfide interchange protein DsbE